MEHEIDRSGMGKSLRHVSHACFLHIFTTLTKVFFEWRTETGDDGLRYQEEDMKVFPVFLYIVEGPRSRGLFFRRLEVT